MTLQQAIKELYPTLEEEEQDRYYVAHPDNTSDIIRRIQRGAYISATE